MSNLSAAAAAAENQGFGSARKAIEHNSASYIEWQEIKVEFSDSLLLSDYADMLHEQAVVQLDNFSVTRDEIESYLKTLLWLRIMTVRGARNATNDYHGSVVVPAFWSVYLAQVGEVVDDGLGVRLLPDTNIEPLDPDTFHKLTIRLRKLDRTTLQYATELSRDKRGDFRFMTIQLLDEKVTSHLSDLDPWVAFLGTFVTMEQVQQVFNPLVSYGGWRSYRMGVHDLV